MHFKPLMLSYLYIFILWPSIHCSTGSAPVSVQANRTGYPGLSPVLVSIAFPFAFHISVFFHSLFFTWHWISFVFLLYDWCICTHQSTFHLLTFSMRFQAWDWLWYPRQGRGAHEAEISFKISALTGVWTLELAIWWSLALPLDYGAPLSYDKYQLIFSLINLPKLIVINRLISVNLIVAT